MAYIRIRIPTGYREVEATVSTTRFIFYRCCECGKPASYSIELSKSALTRYHTLHKQETKEARKNEARRSAGNSLRALDESLFNRINIQHDYEAVPKGIVCPHCGATQIWSGVSRSWTHTSIFPFWLILGFIPVSVPFLILSPLANDIATSLATLSCSVAYFVALPSLYSLLRERKMARLRSGTFVPPVYINGENMFENEAFATLLQKDETQNQQKVRSKE